MYKPVEVAHIFEQGFSDYLKAYGPLPKEHYKVANAIMCCRTEQLGGHVYRCDECEHEMILYNSCRNRHCPKCQAYARAKWVKTRIGELLPVQYFHVVFTVPSELNPFALRNKKVFYNILFESVKETLRELALDKKRLGAEIGFIGVLHTWGQNLMDHPHIHCIVPGGGIVPASRKWKSSNKDFLFPFQVMRSLFRGKMLCYFKQAVSSGKIMFHGSLSFYKNDGSALQRLLDNLYRKKWVVYPKEPFACAEAVLKYLGRYTHRIAISNQRLVSMEDGKVTFRYKDYADGSKEKLMSLSLVEFIRRFFLHVMPHGFMRIRHFGFLSNRSRKVKLSLCMKLFKKRYDKKVKSIKALKWNEVIKEISGKDPTICPVCCKGRLKLCGEIPRKTWQFRIAS